MTKLDEIFYMEYGKDNLLSKDTVVGGKTPLISSKGTNNGIMGYVDKEPTYEKVINVPRTGTVCHAFYQDKGCCINSDSIVLIPKKEIPPSEMIYISLLIRKEVFKYSYGRKVTPKRLGGISLPKKFPDWVYTSSHFDYTHIQQSVNSKRLNLGERKWKKFLYSGVFDIERGYYNKRPNKTGDVNFVSASMFNNGVTDKLDKGAIEKMFDGNCITVVNNGHAGEAFYQKNDFTCSHDVNILRIKDKEMTSYIAMFLIPIIRKEKYRFNYGRKWRYERMQKSTIKLPVNSSGDPDWEFMEDYIKSLPYSKAIAS